MDMRTFFSLLRCADLLGVEKGKRKKRSTRQQCIISDYLTL